MIKENTARRIREMDENGNRENGIERKVGRLFGQRWFPCKETQSLLPFPETTFFLFSPLSLSLFFFLPRTNIPLSPDLVARRKGHSLRVHRYLCYIQESITILTSSLSGNSILSWSKQTAGIMARITRIIFSWSSVLKLQHCRSWSLDSNRSITEWR